MGKFKRVISSYFFVASEIAKKYSKEIVVMQFFQRQENVVLAGILEIRDLLREEIESGNIKIKALEEGSNISPLEVVLELEGRYEYIAIYEGIIDGILSRASSLATNARRCIDVAKDIPILCFSDRSDHYRNIDSDCWAYYVGGIRAFSAPNLKENKYYKELSDSKREDIEVYYSLPHGAIQIFRGDSIKAMKAYNDLFPELPLVALVDFNNDVIGESLKLFAEFKDRLYGVRVDTHNMLQDLSLTPLRDKPEYKGVNPTLVRKLREELDKVGGKNVKIYLSSGFNPEKIARFIESKVPVDGFGVGEYLSKVNISFTGDLVKLGSEYIAKAGRRYRENPRILELKVGEVQKDCEKSEQRY